MQTTNSDVDTRAFASKVFKELLAHGLEERHARRVMRAAGPGRAMKSILWAEAMIAKMKREAEIEAGRQWGKAFDEASTLNLMCDYLDCLLTGAGGGVDFGQDRMKRVLRLAKIDPPADHCSTGFFRILKGAREAMRWMRKDPE
jgi:hypothetical protein